MSIPRPNSGPNSVSTALPVVVLCGGLGTRLRGVVADRPKALAEVAGKPFLAYLLQNLHRDGFEDIILSAGYKGDQIQDFVDTHFPTANIRVIHETTLLGTGGALRFAVQQALTHLQHNWDIHATTP